MGIKMTSQSASTAATGEFLPTQVPLQPVGPRVQLRKSTGSPSKTHPSGTELALSPLKLSSLAATSESGSLSSHDCSGDGVMREWPQVMWQEET